MKSVATTSKRPVLLVLAESGPYGRGGTEKRHKPRQKSLTGGALHKRLSIGAATGSLTLIVPARHKNYRGAESRSTRHRISFWYRPSGQAGYECARVCAVICPRLDLIHALRYDPADATKKLPFSQNWIEPSSMQRSIATAMCAQNPSPNCPSRLLNAGHSHRHSRCPSSS
jgi:hypothetical protein